MEYANGRTFLITEDLKVVVSSWKLNTSIFIVNKNNKCSIFEVDKWTEFKKSIKDIDDEFNKRFVCLYPNLDLIQGKEMIITGDLKVIVTNWKSNTTIFVVNNDGGYHFAFLNFEMWKEFKKRINDIDFEFNRRFKYQYADV